ncbi:hypothetical protein Salat_0242200 [Sesamum alatum]|uniref:Endonuclease/exonuclease/phosphatase domain-containing protein n=1 Tax=Sesamum alatum TaxID=300844 RepID=A0AAE1YZC2_9LAMI|nr:hypothetical protein Salat_0242200 [Sesamum alatum]
MPWLILGDFNCVKSPAEKQLGVAPTWYELKDFTDCFLSLGLHDAPTTGCYYTWYSNSDSNPMWCKLDWVLLNNEWLEAGLHCNVNFSPPGNLSDHSSGIVSILDLPTPRPFSVFQHMGRSPGLHCNRGTWMELGCGRHTTIQPLQEIEGSQGPSQSFQ